MMYKTTVGLVLLSLLVSSDALRILVVYPMVSKSHSILGYGMVNRLLEAGHEVVHITSFPRGQVVPNLKELNVSSVADDMQEHTEDFKLKNVIGKENIGESVLFTYLVYTIHKRVLEEPQVVKLFSDPNEKFDAVVAEWFFTELFAGIPALFECPMIWVSSTELHWQVMRVADGLTNPAYTLDLFSKDKLPLNFWQRAVSLYKLVKKNVQLFILNQVERWTYNNIYPAIAAKRGVTMPSYQDAVFNGSLLFVNSHPSIGGAMKLPQNTINIAGYHIDKLKPLPKFILPFISTHPNLKLFITHGGMLSTTEAVHTGVPLVGIPVAAEQTLNMKNTEAKGFGIHVTLSEDMIPELDAAVKKVLGDDTYRKRAKEISRLFHDRSMTPGAAVPYWVEYVVRNRGAHHLRSPALDVPLYQKLYLDLALVLLIIIAIIKKAVKFVLSKRSKKQKKVKKN